MMDVMSVKDERLACFGPRCSHPLLSICFTILTPVRPAILMIVTMAAT